MIYHHDHVYISNTEPSHSLLFNKYRGITKIERDSTGSLNVLLLTKRHLKKNMNSRILSVAAILINNLIARASGKFLLTTLRNLIIKHTFYTLQFTKASDSFTLGLIIQKSNITYNTIILFHALKMSLTSWHSVLSQWRII